MDRPGTITHRLYRLNDGRTVDYVPNTYYHWERVAYTVDATYNSAVNRVLNLLARI